MTERLSLGLLRNNSSEVVRAGRYVALLIRHVSTLGAYEITVKLCSRVTLTLLKLFVEGKLSL